MNKTISSKIKKTLVRFRFILGIMGLVILVSTIIFGGIKASDFLQVKKLVKASDSLVIQEKYKDAYNNLILTQTHWTTSKVKKEIESKMVQDKQLISDQDNYTNANDFFGQSKWQEAKDSYSKVSNTYPHYQDAQDRIKLCQDKIDEAIAAIASVLGPSTQTTKNTENPYKSASQTDYKNCVQNVTNTSNNALKDEGDTYKKNIYTCIGVGDKSDFNACEQEYLTMHNSHVAELNTMVNTYLAQCEANYSR